MSDKIFLDSNILVYCYSISDIQKQNIARKLSQQKDITISTQVLNETISVLAKKYKIQWIHLKNLIEDFEAHFQINTVKPTDIKKACDIAEKYGFSYFDSLIIASAIISNCSILYSEDLQNGQVIEGSLKVVNPFL